MKQGTKSKMGISATRLRVIKSPVGPTPRRGLLVLAFIETLLLSVWLGSMSFFSFVAAPSSFLVVPSNELAGRLVTRLIVVLEWAGLLIGPALVIIAVATWRTSRPSRAVKPTRLVLLAIMTGAAALSRFFVTPTLVVLRESMGSPIETLAATDPLRVQFNDLHHYSVGLMSLAIFCGIVVMFLTVCLWFRR